MILNVHLLGDPMAAITEKILDFLQRQEDPCNAYTIAKEITENIDSVRTRLSELHRESKIYKHSRGFYSCKPSHGLGLGVGNGSGGLRVQNLVVVAAADVLEHYVVVKEWPSIDKVGFGRIKISIVFGAKRRQISWMMAAPLGLDYVGFLLCQAYVESICFTHGFEALVWEVKNIEVLNDYLGSRLEGLTAFTIDHLDSTLVKMYQKEYGVRYEVKTSRIISLDDLFYLFHGGSPSYITARDIHAIQNSISAIVESVKFLNQRFNNLVISLEKLPCLKNTLDPPRAQESSPLLTGFRSATMGLNITTGRRLVEETLPSGELTTEPTSPEEETENV